MRTSALGSLVGLLVFTVPLGCGGASPAASPGGETLTAGDEGGAGGARLLPPMRPCEVTQVTAPGASNECVTVERVQPEGRPYPACNGYEGPARFRYDGDGRIVESPSGRFRYAGNTATVLQGDVLSSYEFDAAHRIVRMGVTEYAYDEYGRRTLETSGERYVRYTYAADETYTTRHNYPDTDEFCVGSRVEVVHDEAGRAILDRYDGCRINEPAYTLRFAYEGDQISRVEVDTGSDGSVDRVLTLRYSCSDPT